MRFLIFWAITVVCPAIHAEQQNIASDDRKESEIRFDIREPLFVSLGPECYFAWYLEELGYRRAAFPFDWLITFDEEKFIELIEHDFEYFFDESCYQINSRENLAHSYYHIEFLHDTMNDECMAKYQRRIKRFRDLDHYPGRVYFLRKAHPGADGLSHYWPSKGACEIKKEWALRLEHALLKRFPHLDFKLILVNFSADHMQIEELGNLIWFNFPRPALFYREGNTPKDYLQCVIHALLKARN